ncbi:MAG TPA: hypothetical protein VHC63_13425 [Acidimicrobiales bacterium]|nr:hypothetical protein [Acidimicrobiales bacterium]
MTAALLSHSEHKADTVPSMRAFLADVAKQIKKNPDAFVRALGGEDYPYELATEHVGEELVVRYFPPDFGDKA